MDEIDLSYIDGKNDRRNLILLLNKEKKTDDDQSVITILSTVYPDFLNYHVRELSNDLYGRGFIKPTRESSPFDERIEGLPEWITTPDGERALEVEFFPSEYKAKNYEAKRKEKEAENLDLYNKELKRNRIISWVALLISIASIAIAAVALLKEL